MIDFLRAVLRSRDETVSRLSIRFRYLNYYRSNSPREVRMIRQALKYTRRERPIGWKARLFHPAAWNEIERLIDRGEARYSKHRLGSYREVAGL
jgi:hypothetical protein